MSSYCTRPGLLAFSTTFETAALGDTYSVLKWLCKLFLTLATNEPRGVQGRTLVFIYLLMGIYPDPLL